MILHDYEVIMLYKGCFDTKFNKFSNSIFNNLHFINNSLKVKYLCDHPVAKVPIPANQQMGQSFTGSGPRVVSDVGRTL